MPRKIRANGITAVTNRIKSGIAWSKVLSPFRPLYRC
jgi:hypothetical protein